jgi:hypothetical protein
MVETEEDLANIDEDDLIMLLSVKNLPTSNTLDENLNTLREFCRLDYGPDLLKQAQNPFYQPLANQMGLLVVGDGGDLPSGPSPQYGFCIRHTLCMAVH